MGEAEALSSLDQSKSTHGRLWSWRQLALVRLVRDNETERDSWLKRFGDVCY